MDIEALQELCREAASYRIKHSYGHTGGDFDYKIIIGKELEFRNSRAASKFIDAIVDEYRLDRVDRIKLPPNWRL
jgi:hypothetical protein